uniref:Uncharacterized protein n=1 Tax=Romanomermis culicivorax TaxID=13658 RepID=A0A915KEI1_ROMCU
MAMNAENEHKPTIVIVVVFLKLSSVGPTNKCVLISLTPKFLDCHRSMEQKWLMRSGMGQIPMALHINTNFSLEKAHGEND